MSVQLNRLPRGAQVFVLVAGVKGSSEYFCRSANTQKGDSGGHAYLLQKFEEHTKGGCSKAVAVASSAAPGGVGKCKEEMQGKRWSVLPL